MIEINIPVDEYLDLIGELDDRFYGAGNWVDIVLANRMTTEGFIEYCQGWIERQLKAIEDRKRKGY